MAELDPFENFPQFDPSDLSFSDLNLFPDGDFPMSECFGSDPNLDDIDVDLDFSINDLFLPQSEENPNGSSPNPHFNPNSDSNLITDSNSNRGSPESGNSSFVSGVNTHQQLKRKMDDENDRIGNPSPNPSSLNRKRRSDEVNSSRTISVAAEEGEKRKARLMRNRESAQLSRQRKKHYVEELVEKVKAMSSTIANLNGKISFYMAENARLQQQLNGSSGNGNDNNVNGSLVYLPLPPYHFPWVPYPMRSSGAPVPYLPIPRLKPQQPAASPKVKKPENKKSRTKKIASVSLFGVLLVMMLFAGVMNFGFGGSREKGNGIVLSVNGNGGSRSLNNTQESGLCSGKMGSNHCGVNDSSESLPAFLYVPRNGKHVEINGNLIIHSVLAGEKAMAEAKSKGREKQLSDSKGTALAIPCQVPSPLAVSNGAVEVGKVGRHSGACRNAAEHPRALVSDSHITYGDSMESTLSDGPLQQWFREGLAGPILSSGTCTEIFQFEVSPNGIVPATTVVNTTETTPPGKIKNRRIFYGHQIPLNGSTLNNTQHLPKTTESNNKFNTNNNSASSMVVSVLVDPRETGDGDGNGMITPKSVSRIFVVVLIDSVKYVAYSCMLPLKSHAPLVNKL